MSLESTHFFILLHLSSKPPLHFSWTVAVAWWQSPFLPPLSSYLALLIGNHIPEPLSSPWPTNCMTRLPPHSSLVPGSLLCWGDLWQAYSPQGSLPAPLLGCPSSRYFLTCSLMKCYLCREPAPTTLCKTGFLVLLYTSQWHLPTVSCASSVTLSPSLDHPFPETRDLSLSSVSNHNMHTRVLRSIVGVKHWSEVKVAQSCPTLCNPMDSTAHGILQARIPEWVACPFSRGSSQPRDRTQVSRIAGGFFTSRAIREAH